MLKIEKSKALITPQKILKAYPLSPDLRDFVLENRRVIHSIMDKNDSRLLVILGPCSIHDPVAAIEYAQRLKKTIDRYHPKLFIVMRAYFQKPRTARAWKGWIDDPRLNESFNINYALTSARKLLLTINSIGVPVATEFLDAFAPCYLSDLMAWTTIGARTVESPLHRSLASALPTPVGFKNNTDGNIGVALDAMEVAACPQNFFSITSKGKPALIRGKGNPYTHLILRGGLRGSNYDEATLLEAVRALKTRKLNARVMIDCAHGNSQKDPIKQLKVLDSVNRQIKKGSTSILGIMFESFLIEGQQALRSDRKLIYGKSITDACLGWEDTENVLAKLAA